MAKHPTIFTGNCASWFSLDYGNNDKKERHDTPLRAALQQEQRYGCCRWDKLRLRFWFGMQQVLL